MNIDRKEMIKTLQTHVVPELRALGFKGSFPHFYKKSEEYCYLLCFQFRSCGGSFCVEISYVDPKQTNICFGNESDIKKIKVSATMDRMRLRLEKATRTLEGVWFIYSPNPFLDELEICLTQEKIVSKINELIIIQAIPWWEGKCSNKS